MKNVQVLRETFFDKSSLNIGAMYPGEAKIGKGRAECQMIISAK